MADDTQLRWLPATDKRFTVRGLGWYHETGNFRRLPARAQASVSEGVWGNAQCSSGVRLCFRSNTEAVHVRVKLDRPSAMAHMPATGQSGVTLFSGAPYCLRPWGQAFPSPAATEYSGCLCGGLSRTLRDYTIYLPLYNGVEEMSVGLSKGARILPPAPPVLQQPAVVYGTSITMGGCAHTPDADYPSIVGRRLNLDTINLGFSGAGRGEPEVAELLAELDACVYVLDYAANVDAKRLRSTLPRFIKILRAQHPQTPILLLSRTLGYAAHHSAGSWDGLEDRRDEIIYCYARLRRAGDRNLHFIDGNALLPPCTELVHSDGGHPTSVGFQMIADRLAPQLENIVLARRSVV